MQIIPQTTHQMESISKKTSLFFHQYRIGQILRSANACKLKGFSAILVFLVLVSIIFENRSLYMQRRLHEAMETAAQTAVDAEKWIGLMKQYVNPTELTAELLNTLIEKILIHEAVKSEDGSREQEVEIFYRFIGKIE